MEEKNNGKVGIANGVVVSRTRQLLVYTEEEDIEVGVGKEETNVSCRVTTTATKIDAAKNSPLGVFIVDFLIDLFICSI